MLKCHTWLVFLLVHVVAAQAADDYVLGPDSQFKAAVPHGRVERFQFTNSTVFPGTVRDGGVYIPAQYDPAKPAALMVLQDGLGAAGSVSQGALDDWQFHEYSRRSQLPGLDPEDGAQTDSRLPAGWVERFE